MTAAILTLLLPWSAQALDISGLSTRWLMPAATPATVRSAAWTDVRFGVDGRGRPWIAHDGEELVCPTEASSVRMVAPIDDIAFTGTLSPLVSSEGHLSVLPAVLMLRGDKDGRLALPLKPLRRLPGPGSRLFPGTRGILYVASRAKGNVGGSLYLLRGRSAKGSRGRLELLLEASEPVAAAAGDGKTTYTAVGRSILKLQQGARKAESVFAHPREDISSLAFDPEVGLFYATASEVGFVGPKGALRILKAARPLIAAWDGGLFVFSQEDWSIARLDGLKFLATASAGPPTP
ncbi:MAG: hypothetical protein HY551_07950 [Elusimicrobia bacterium]|nr:hypothetical protein [Elusimicrobiota bacterium]